MVQLKKTLFSIAGIEPWVARMVGAFKALTAWLLSHPLPRAKVYTEQSVPEFEPKQLI